MLLSAADGETFVDHSSQWELVDDRAEDSQDEHHPTLTTGVYGLPDGGRPVGLESQLLLDLVVEVMRSRAVRFHADGFDADVGPAAAGPLTQLRTDVRAGVVDGLRADVAFGHGQPLGIAIDRDDPLGTEQHGGSGGHLPDRATTPHGHHVAGADTAEVCAHPPGGHRVRHEQRAPVIHLGRHGEGPVVGERYPDVLGVTASEAAHRVGVAEDTAGLVAEQRRSDTRVGVAVVAQ